MKFQPFAAEVVDGTEVRFLSPGQPHVMDILFSLSSRLEIVGILSTTCNGYSLVRVWLSYDRNKYYLNNLKTII
jgi:hypothetical protein